MQISETMFRSFCSEMTDENRKIFVRQIASAVVGGLAPQNVAIMLMSHDTRSWAEHWGDQQYAHEAYEYLSTSMGFTCLVQPPELTQAELLAIPQFCDVLICGRMHMSVTACLADVVPIVVTGSGQDYDMLDKVRGMCMEWMGTDANLAQSLEEIPLLRDKVMHDNFLKDALTQKQMEVANILPDERAKLAALLDVHSVDWDEENMQEIVLMQAMERAAQLSQELIAEENERKNKEAHIELLLQSERDLLKEKQILEQECQKWQDKQLQLQTSHQQLQNEIAAIKNSRTWKVGRFFAKIVRFFVPSGSKRALILRLLMTLIKHPGKFFKALTLKKMKKFFKLLRQGNISGIRTLIYANVYGGMVPPPELVVEAPKIKEISTQNSREKNFEDYTVLQIPQWEEPQVSIIIPVYNQFDYTYLCVESILENSGDITYEIIIANDCSTDLTTRIEEIMPGICCVTNEQNLRFLLNCNHAAKYARGKYVLFLNNDTQVQENWLEPLVTLIESADDIGMVGSKLICPDGLLQEAGGIVWKDATAWNYGNRQNPALPEYNYVKEVDYISGAAIMLSRTLWEEIGGFDERFAPAYYEDTDLAFTVRSKGYRVMYQPKSVVVHFEGVSNGTDTSTGLKQYQVENNIKFYEKWKDVLATHPENGEDVFTARDRSYGKTTVLVIDHYVPMFDKDAGSRMEYQYVKLLAEMGYNVKFIGDNFFPHQPYTSALEQLGIEVLYGNEYFHNWKQWILDNADQFDVVFTSRPHITVKYIDLLKKYTKARIIYNLCDLHYLREMRQYEVTGDEAIRESAEATKIREFELIEKSDRVFSVSADEVKILSEFFPVDKTVQCPIFIFDEFVDVLPQRQDTKDLMFVGGFGHTPNVDAMKWFCADVFPLIQREIPDIKLHIVGSKPPEEIKAFASESIIVEGFVSDEKLLELYQTCRVDVIPLRYGAGVKGKSIEAMYNGIPIVTTSIGIEGLPEIEKCITAYDDAENFAAEVVRVYKNGDGGCAQRCYDYVRAHFSEEYAKEFFSREFVPM